MKKAFTLSEVLITLGIIGIIAVLTVPAVMKNYRNRMYVAQLRKVYSQLSDAAQAIMNDQKAAHFSETTAAAATSCTNRAKGECQAGAGYFLNTYLKLIKRDCGFGKPNPCAVASYQSINGANAGTLAGDYCVQTTNGAAMCMRYDTANKIAEINIDVNGPSEPNTTGRDVFWIIISDDGRILDHDNNPDNCSNPGSGGCLTKIMRAGWRMDY